MKPGSRRFGTILGYLVRNLLEREAIHPFYASFKLTYACPLRCSFCDIKGTSGPAEADTEDVFRVLGALARSSILVLVLEGGEPFLRRDIVEILDRAARFPWLVSAVTSYPNRCDDLRPRVSQFIDFLQISIDEEHGNLHLLDRLGELRRAWTARLGVQIVVTRSSLGALEEKIACVRRAGLRAVVMPAVDLDGCEPCSPSRAAFTEEIARLQRRHRGTIVTSRAFQRSFATGGRCSTASIVVDPDGSVYYPCRVLGNKAHNLLTGDLDEFLRSPLAGTLRRVAADCPRACGWYQHFAVRLDSVRHLLLDLHAGLERTR